MTDFGYFSCNRPPLWENTDMKTATRNSRNSIDSLARLLASENISIQHQPVPTAAFDTLSRTLILPIWEDMTQEVYDMLVGHEVGHALFTPAGEEALMAALARINRETGANQGLAKTALNIIEDARIERMMKDKYPGLRRDFVRGYSWLHGRDFFGIANADVEDLTILDRLNLHYKLGTIDITIPFNAIEKVFVQKIDAIRTWEDVVDVAVEVLSFYKDNRPEQEQNDQPEQPEPQGEGEEGGDTGMSGDDGFEDDNNGAGADDNDSNEDGDEAGGSSQEFDGDSDADGDEDTTPDGAGDNGEDSGMSMEDDTDDGESAESTTGESTASNEQGEPGEGLVNEGGWGNELDSRTESNLAENLAKQANTEAQARQYVDAPNMNLENIIVTPERIAEYWNGSKANMDGADRLRKMWERINMPVINNMAKQFEMKKAADMARRTMSSKTGRLDMNRLHAYKTSDDIFLSAETMRDGKNHGLVMFIDWSGSMCDNLAGTISQLLNLVYFCKKANVPFEVYAFTSVIGNDYRYGLDDAENAKQEAYENLPMNAEDDELHIDKFRLLNFFNSNMNNRQFRAAVQQMMILMASNMGRADSEDMFGIDQYAMYDMIQDRNTGGQLVPRAINLGCTPLNEAILAAKDIVNGFKSRNNVQICNTVFLTDGEASSRFHRRNGNYGESLILSHRRKDFDLSSRSGCTNELLKWLEATTGCNTLGFFIANWQDFRRAMHWNTFGEIPYEAQEDMVKEYKKNGFNIMPDHPGYKEFYVIDMNPKTRKSVGFDDLDSDASLTRIKNAFMKQGNTKKTNRKIMVRFAEIFATNKG